VVAVVAREIETEQDHLHGEWERLGRLLKLDEGRPDDRETLRADISARTELLVQRIRAGDADAGRWRDDVLAHLRRTVADKLDVARPPRVD
jgi:predicted NBD/HSP70 family sugar kinase